jgi:hypothetical protein
MPTIYELLKSTSEKLPPQHLIAKVGYLVAMKAKDKQVRPTKKTQVETYEVADYPEDFKEVMLETIEDFLAQRAKVTSRPKQQVNDRSSKGARPRKRIPVFKQQKNPFKSTQQGL